MATNPVTPAPFEDLRKAANTTAFVRKFSQTILYLGPEDAPDLTSLIDESGTMIAPIPPEYWPVGLLAKDDGVKVATDISWDETEALGYSDPILKTADKTDRKLTFSPFELMRWPLFALTHGIPVEPVPAMGANGEVVVDTPPMPTTEFFRGIRVSVDGAGNRLWVYGSWFPRLQNESIPEESFTSAAQVAPLEMTISTDTVVGTPARHFIGGPAMLANREALGYVLGDAGTVPVP